jgi:ATP-dependent DNA ligase
VVILNHKPKDKAYLILQVLNEMFHLATSKYCIIDSYVIPVSILKHRNKLVIIQIWHALGAIKKFGYASLGLKESDLKLLKEYRNQLTQDECPFIESSISSIDVTGTELTWVNPAITCWISFLELSNDGHFRHPKIIGFTALPVEEANGRILTD